MAQSGGGPAGRSGTFVLGGDLPVHRLGFGAMHVTGAGVWGEPADRDQAIAVLRRSLQLGITLIDTADAYGPAVSEQLIAAALHPYPADLVIATKGGLVRPGPGAWTPNGRPEHLRAACHGSLTRLKLERIDLYQLHRIDPHVALEDQIGALRQLQQEGKIRHIGLSEATVTEIDRVRRLVPVVSVQNRYSATDRHYEGVVDYCTRERLGFIPWFPLDTGRLARQTSPFTGVAARLHATPAQVAIAWLLHRSPVMLPIPGTSSVAHLEENTAAAALQLDEATAREVAMQHAKPEGIALRKRSR